MKKKDFLKLLVFFLFLMQNISSFAQNYAIAQVKETIKAGSAKELSKYLNQTVDVTIEGNVQS
jgi:hypothetical protein